MADLLRNGLSWLEQQRLKHMAGTVTYQHGSTSHDVLATVGRSAFELVDSNGVVMRLETRDYLISAASLEVEPKAGHRITDSGHVYEVSEVPGEPAWRWTDPLRQTYRIHTKEVKG